MADYLSGTHRDEALLKALRPAGLAPRRMRRAARRLRVREQRSGAMRGRAKYLPRARSVKGQRFSICSRCGRYGLVGANGLCTGWTEPTGILRRQSLRQKRCEAIAKKAAR